LFLLARALFDLRARAAAPEVMAVGLSLVGLAFSHPIGGAIVVAVMPWLLFAVRPTLVANSAFNVVLVLMFPTLFTVGAFAYVSWVFPGAGWSFLAAPAESLALWAVYGARVIRDLTGSLALDAMVAVAAALVLGAPIAPVMLIWVRGRRPLIAPPAVLAVSVVVAAAISVASGLFGSPALLAVAAPVLAAVIVARVPVAWERPGTVLALLAAGWLGGIVALAIVEPRASVPLNAALADPAHIDALALGGATIKRDGILVDTDHAPAIVVGRGRAHGLIVPTDPAFTLALMFARIDTPFVAVPDPHSTPGLRDRLNRSFPQLHRDGAPGYRLAYQNRIWRLYARQQQAGK
jgi:hypothetical protein